MNPFEQTSVSEPIQELFSNLPTSFVQKHVANGLVHCRVETKDKDFAHRLLQSVEQVALSPVVLPSRREDKTSIKNLVEEHCCVCVSQVLCTRIADTILYTPLDEFGEVVHDREECLSHLFAAQDNSSAQPISTELGTEVDIGDDPVDWAKNNPIIERQEQEYIRQGYVLLPDSVPSDILSKIGYEHVAGRVYRAQIQKQQPLLQRVSCLVAGDQPEDILNIDLETSFPRLSVYAQYLLLRAYARMVERHPEHKQWITRVRFLAALTEYDETHPQETFPVAAVLLEEARDMFVSFLEEEKQQMQRWQVMSFDSLSTAVAYRWHFQKHGYSGTIVGDYYLALNTRYPDTFDKNNIPQQEEVREQLRQYLVSLAYTCTDKQEEYKDMSLDDLVYLTKIEGNLCILSLPEMLSNKTATEGNREYMLRGYFDWTIGDITVLPGLV